MTIPYLFFRLNILHNRCVISNGSSGSPEKNGNDVIKVLAFTNQVSRHVEVTRHLTEKCPRHCKVTRYLIDPYPRHCKVTRYLIE